MFHRDGLTVRDPCSQSAVASAQPALYSAERMYCSNCHKVIFKKEVQHDIDSRALLIGSFGVVFMLIVLIRFTPLPWWVSIVIGIALFGIVFITTGASRPCCPTCDGTLQRRHPPGVQSTADTSAPPCPRCGRHAPSRAKFCPACGGEMAGEAGHGTEEDDP